jgi:hypothetical protein
MVSNQPCNRRSFPSPSFLASAVYLFESFGSCRPRFSPLHGAAAATDLRHYGAMYLCCIFWGTQATLFLDSSGTHTGVPHWSIVSCLFNDHVSDFPVSLPPTLMSSPYSSPPLDSTEVYVSAVASWWHISTSQKKVDHGSRLNHLSSFLQHRPMKSTSLRLNHKRSHHFLQPKKYWQPRTKLVTLFHLTLRTLPQSLPASLIIKALAGINQLVFFR